MAISDLCDPASMKNIKQINTVWFCCDHYNAKVSGKLGKTALIQKKLSVNVKPQLHRRSFLAEILETVFLIVAIYALVNLATARFVVEGASMQPNFSTGQFLIISRLEYLFSGPDYGDIVVFHYPNNIDDDYIKRVIGLPGDTVSIENAEVYLNGEKIQEPYINEVCMTSICEDNVWELAVGEFFVMGDNRNHSQDSRSFGPVAEEFIIGEALFRYWPPEDWGIVRQIRLHG